MAGELRKGEDGREQAIYISELGEEVGELLMNPPRPCQR